MLDCVDRKAFTRRQALKTIALASAEHCPSPLPETHFAGLRSITFLIHQPITTKPAIFMSICSDSKSRKKTVGGHTCGPEMG